MKQISWLDQDINDTIKDMDVAVAMLRVEAGPTFVLAAINSAMKTLLQTDENPMGRSMLEFKFVGIAVLRELQQFAEDCFTDKCTKSFERFVTLRKGQQIWMSYSMIPMIRHGESVAIMVTVRDVTDLIAVRRHKQLQFTEIANRFFRVCAWCGSVAGEDNEWSPVRDYIKHFPSHDLLTRLCPDCRGSG